MAIPLASGQEAFPELGDEVVDEPLIAVAAGLASGDRVQLDASARSDVLVDRVLTRQGVAEMRASAQTAEDQPALVEGYRASFTLSAPYRGPADFARTAVNGNKMIGASSFTTVGIEEMTRLDVLYDQDMNVIAVVPGIYTRWAEPEVGDTVTLGSGGVYVFDDGNYAYDAESGTIEFLDESLFPESDGE